MALASLSLPGKWRSFRKSLARNRKGVAMAHGLPLPEGRVEGDHGLSPSPLEKLRIVAFALLNLRSKGAMAVTLTPCSSKPSRRKSSASMSLEMCSLSCSMWFFQKEGWKVTIHVCWKR